MPLACSMPDGAANLSRHLFVKSLPFLDPRKTNPHPSQQHNHAQDHRLQHLDALTRSNGADRKGKHGAARAAHGHAESNTADVDMLGEQFRRHHDAAREHWAEKEAQKRDGHGGHDELRDEPEDEFQREAEGEVDQDAHALAEAFGHEAQSRAAQGLAGPEARA